MTIKLLSASSGVVQDISQKSDRVEAASVGGLFHFKLMSLVGTKQTCRSPRRMSVVGGIVLQNSQNAERLIFREETKQATIADQYSLKPVAGIACEFGERRRSPPHNYSNRRAYGSEILSPMPQKDFCNTIGGTADKFWKYSHFRF
jgi:hypothetical protein